MSTTCIPDPAAATPSAPTRWPIDPSARQLVARFRAMYPTRLDAATLQRVEFAGSVLAGGTKEPRDTWLASALLFYLADLPLDRMAYLLDRSPEETRRAIEQGRVIARHLKVVPRADRPSPAELLAATP